MEYLAYIVFIFTSLQLITALANWLFREELCTNNGSLALVSILVPARNEAHNLPNLLSDLANQDYRHIEVLVFNDQSTDGTADVVRSFSRKDPRIKLIESEGLPPGWLGKNHACHSLATQATGSYLLFIDADVRLKPGLVGQAIATLAKQRVSLLSLFPVQTMRTHGEYKTVPLLNYVLLTLLPLRWVRQSWFSSHSAACGQFMLFDAATYKTYWPHRQMKANRAEDVAIARFLKRNRKKIACLLAPADLTCRMYTSYGDAVDGFSKNITSFFGNSFVLSVLFWAVTTLGFVPVWLHLGVWAMVAYVLAVVATRALVSVASGQSVTMNIRFLVAQQISLGQIIIASIKKKLTNQYTWKNRNLSV